MLHSHATSTRDLSAGVPKAEIRTPFRPRSFALPSCFRWVLIADGPAVSKLPRSGENQGGENVGRIRAQSSLSVGRFRTDGFDIRAGSQREGGNHLAFRRRFRAA